MQSRQLLILLILLYIGPSFSKIVFVISFNQTHISSFEPVEITTASGPGTLSDFNQIPYYDRVLIGPKGSYLLAIARKTVFSFFHASKCKIFHFVLL